MPIPRPEIDYLRVATLEMAVFGAARFATLPSSDWPFCAPAIPIHGSPTLARGLDGWPEDLPRNVVYSADMLETALELARRGLAVVYLPTFLARLHGRWVTGAGRLEALPTPRAAARRKREVYLVKRKATPESRVMMRIARGVRRALRG